MYLNRNWKCKGSSCIYLETEHRLLEDLMRTRPASPKLSLVERSNAPPLWLDPPMAALRLLQGLIFRKQSLWCLTFFRDCAPQTCLVLTHSWTGATDLGPIVKFKQKRWQFFYLMGTSEYPYFFYWDHWDHWEQMLNSKKLKSYFIVFKVKLSVNIKKLPYAYFFVNMKKKLRKYIAKRCRVRFITGFWIRTLKFR